MLSAGAGTDERHIPTGAELAKALERVCSLTSARIRASSARAWKRERAHTTAHGAPARDSSTTKTEPGTALMFASYIHGREGQGGHDPRNGVGGSRS